MIKNNWKEIWRKRTGDLNMLENTSGETVRKPLRGDNRILNVGLSPKQS